jgi:hypothetical protein
VGFDAARQLASDLCDLCSLGFGTLTTWLCCDVLTRNGEWKYSYHYPALARPYIAGFPLIDRTSALEVKAFLEECYSTYVALRKDRDFRAVVHALCDVRGTAFLDTRALLCVSLLEHIIGKDAREHEALTVLPTAQFCDGEQELRKGVEFAVQRAFPNADKKQLEQMVGHVSGFNRTSPSARLKQMAARLGINFTSKEVRQSS